MKPVFTIIGAVSFVAFASYFVNAAPTAADPRDRVHAAGDPLRRYCVDVLGGRGPRAALARKSGFHPLDCVGLFTVAADAEPGQPGRGGDGGGFPGAPGGRGGESGAAGGRGGDGGSILLGLPRRGARGAIGPAPEDLAVDEEFVSYCVSVLQRRGRVASDDFMPSDCAYYLMALDRLSRYPSAAKPTPGSAKEGRDGPSISGGIGGRGGKAGSGPGGGAGGAGGAGVESGLGGAGGAGGASR